MLKMVMLKIRRWLRYRAKKIKLERIIQARGGFEMKRTRRLAKKYDIFLQKRTIIQDLYQSWKIDEIKKPDPKDLALLKAMGEKIPWATLIDIKKKYWHENI